jgi:uncharacterized membrane protein
MAAAVLTAVILPVSTPHCGRVPGWWLVPVLEVILLGILIVQDPGRIDRRSAALRRLTIVLLVVMATGTALAVVVLVDEILNSMQGVTTTVLLGRGAMIWVTNVIVFSLWYWQFDRGGPTERAARSAIPLSFAFPENATPELVPAGWVPEYPDYLHLSFTNATAFSPTDTLPVRRWAKMTMLVQVAVSLVTAVLVLARAINILPG